MATDIQQVRNSLVEAARYLIGERLSTIPGQDNTQKPAILKSRKKFPLQKYPFITLGTGVRKRIGAAHLRKILMEDDSVEYETHYSYLFSYTTFGGDAFDIAAELEAGFREEGIFFQLASSNITIVDTTDVIPSMIKEGDEFIEVATFNLEVSIPDISRRDEGLITDVSLHGELSEHKDDPNPTPLEIPSIL